MAVSFQIARFVNCTGVQMQVLLSYYVELKVHHSVICRELAIYSGSKGAHVVAHACVGKKSSLLILLTLTKSERPLM